jgi:chromosome segregation ATPase
MSQIVEELSKSEMDQSEGSDHPSALAVSVDEFAALEERVVRAIQLVKQERQARLAAEGTAAQAEARLVLAESHAAQMESRAAQLESELRHKEPLLDALQAEIKTMKAERDHVRERVERLLGQLDALEL